MWQDAVRRTSHARVFAPGGAPPRRPDGHADFWRRSIGRRPLVRGAAGTAGALLAPGLWSRGSSEAAAPDAPEPRPITHGLDLGDGLPVIHVLAPRVVGPEDDDPITITDFSGKIGYAVISGTGTGTNTMTGTKTRYSTSVDMRFMTGVYKGLDGRVRGGTFAFI